jgi:hypothetical protein
MTVWPNQQWDQPVDEETPYLASMCFPTLFPNGVGDFTSRFGQKKPITDADAADHYMRYAEIKNGRLVFRFAMHGPFAHWIQNRVERRRLSSQTRYCRKFSNSYPFRFFLSRNPNEAQATPIDLLNLENEEIQSILGRMSRYAGNILGSHAYFKLRKEELEACMKAKGLPTLWISLSCADNHWADFHVFDKSMHSPNLVESQKQRKQFVRDNPHLIDAWFDKRAHLFFKTVIEQGLSSEWWWYRTEYQQRLCPHVHGAFRLKSDPGLHLLGSCFFAYLNKDKKYTLVEKVLEYWRHIRRHLIQAYRMMSG